MTFEQWIADFAPTLWLDSYSFKRELLTAMKRGYKESGQLAAVAAAAPWPGALSYLEAQLVKDRATRVLAVLGARADSEGAK